MTDERTDNDDPGSGARRVLEALRSAASDAATRDTLRELGDRARGVVEELARNARTRAAATASSRRAAGEDAEGPRAAGRSGVEQPNAAELAPELLRRISDLRSCIDELADTMSATVERLETIESQLGDPDTTVDRVLADGLDRCERVLIGIEHRFLRSAEAAVCTGPAAAGPGLAAGPPYAPMPPPSVLVVATSSPDRARWCVELEKQGVRCIAATGLPGALRAAARRSLSATLLVADEDEAKTALALDDWKDAEEQGTLPPVLVLAPRADGGLLRGQAEALGFGFGWKGDGAAGTAAGLLRLAQRDGQAAESAARQEE